MLNYIKQQLISGLRYKGYFVEKPRFNNPLPEMSTLKPGGYWERPYPCHGIKFDDARYLEFLKEFEQFSSEIQSLPQDLFDPKKNFSFLDLDLELLYSMVRLKKPKRIVEVGCGWSSVIIREALNTNLDEGYKCDHVMIEPYPDTRFLNAFEKSPNLMIRPIQEVSIGLFSSLAEGDLFFIDTSHIAKYASDVNYIYFYLLPSVQKGCLIQIHDIFLPYEYPKEWMADSDMMYNEQYIVQAFLMFNSAFNISFPAYYMARKYAKELGALFPRLNMAFSPGGLWLTRET